MHSAQVAKRTAEKMYPRLANKQCRSANMALRSNAPTFQNRTVYLKIQQKHGEKQKWHQRHNPTVLSLLPVARSGAVG
jgi:hypothetical protein